MYGQHLLLELRDTRTEAVQFVLRLSPKKKKVTGTCAQ